MLIANEQEGAIYRIPSTTLDPHFGCSNNIKLTRTNPKHMLLPDVLAGFSVGVSIYMWHDESHNFSDVSIISRVAHVTGVLL